MPIKAEREYRMMPIMRRAEGEEREYWVEGYATTYNDPYVMYEFDGIEYKEQVDPHALDEADLSDVIFQLNHEGRVYARNKNSSLILGSDASGFKVAANLGLTESARSIYEDIDAGLLDAMSWAFVVEEDSYDAAQHLRTILKVKKVYDVSVVSIPQNPDTFISARSYFAGVAEREQQERLEAEKREKQRRKIQLMLEV